MPVAKRPDRRRVLRAALRVFDLFVTSPARKDEDESGSLVPMYLANLFDGCSPDRFLGWSHEAMRTLIAAWVRASPTSDLAELHANAEGELEWLDWFENDRTGEIRGGPLPGARQLVVRSDARRRRAR